MKHSRQSAMRSWAMPIALLLPALFFLTGCFTFDTLIKVNRDGSGTVEQFFSLTGPMIQMLAMFGGEESMDLCQKDDLLKQAAEMGEGVTLVSSKSIDEEERKGCRAVFAFADINTLRINQDPGNRMPSEMGPDEPEEENAPPEYITFTYDNPSTLTVMLPQNFDKQEGQEPPQPTDESQRDMQRQMLQEMLKGGHVQLALQTEASIVATNASYHNNKEITLVEVDFDTLLKDDEQLERLMDAQPRTSEEVKTLLKDVDGIKLETSKKVTVRF